MASVEFVPHDPVWFDRFDRVRARVEDCLAAGLLDVFHVGSTAVPDLPAKPTLDAVAVFEDRAEMASGRDSLLADEFARHRDDPDWVVLTRSMSVADEVLVDERFPVDDGADGDAEAGETRDADAESPGSDPAGGYGVCLHLRPRDEGTWCDQIVLREFLRDDLRARATYERAKRRAAVANPNDVDAYVDAKEPTILSLVSAAYDRGYGDLLPEYAPARSRR